MSMIWTKKSAFQAQGGLQFSAGRPMSGRQSMSQAESFKNFNVARPLQFAQRREFSEERSLLAVLINFPP